MTKTPKIAKAQGRSVKEWIGKTPDSRPPKAVRLRIFERHNGICHISKKKILPGDEWDVEHIVRLDDGGENRESNMAPALKNPHRQKTGQENSRGKKADRAKMKHLGIKDEPARPLESRNDLAGRPKPEKPKRDRKPYVSPFENLGPSSISRRFGIK